MKIRFEVALMNVAMMSAAVALCALLLRAPEPVLAQAPLDDQAQAAARAALAKASFEATAGVLTVYDRQGNIVRTVGERAAYNWPALSPDGTRVAVVRRDQTTQNTYIGVLDLSTGASTRITSDSAPNHPSPVWSPDGSQIVYSANLGGSFGLYRRAANGTGNAELLYQHPGNPPLNATDWSPDGRFLTFHDAASLYVLPLNVGGPADRKAIELVSGKFRAGAGRFSPDGRFLAYASTQSGRWETWVRQFDPSAADGASPAAGPWQISVQGGTCTCAWRQDGKELYYLNPADGGMMAVEVSTAPAFTSGKPRLLFKAPDNVTPDPLNKTTVSRDARQFLFNVSPKPRGTYFPQQITVFDRQGKVVRTLGEPVPGRFAQPVLSPDGTKVAVFLNGEIQVFDVSTGKRAQVTSYAGPGSYQKAPVWSPDGSQIAFFSWRKELGGVYRIASNGTGSEELVYSHQPDIYGPPLTDWSPDGRFLSFSAGAVPWVLPVNPVNGERKAMELLREEYSVYGLRFSPDSRFVAYISDESGRNEVYVRPFDPSSGFAPGGAKWQVSREGGLGLIQWRRDGRELYYLATDGRVMAVDVTTAPAFQAGTPKLLFRAPGTFPLTGVFEREGTNAPECFDTGAGACEQASISRDGQRFAFAVPLPPERKQITVAPGILAKYTGTYVEGEREWVVTLEDNHLAIQRTLREKAPLFAESETKFFLKATNGDFEFVKDDRGDVRYLFMYRGGGPTQLIRQ